MKIRQWFQMIWNKMVRAFKSFIDAAIPLVTQILLAEFKDLAINIVGTLQNTELSNEEKRKQAFIEIKTEVTRRGKSLSDSLINLLIELSLQYIKEKM